MKMLKKIIIPLLTSSIAFSSANFMVFSENFVINELSNSNTTINFPDTVSDSKVQLKAIKDTQKIGTIQVNNLKSGKQLEIEIKGTISPETSSNKNPNNTEDFQLYSYDNLSASVAFEVSLTAESTLPSGVSLSPGDSGSTYILENNSDSDVTTNLIVSVKLKNSENIPIGEYTDQIAYEATIRSIPPKSTEPV